MPTQQRKWRRLIQKVNYWFNQNEESSQFMLQFTHHFAYAEDQTTYFAFTFPFSYQESLDQMVFYENQLLNQPNVYFHKETLYHSVEGRKLELVTISSRDGMTDELEGNPAPKEGLFPDPEQERCRRFNSKKTVFLTSRVHPGETPGSHVLNGFLELLCE
jgi:cytosolic carboxypeptidase protein 5